MSTFKILSPADCAKAIKKIGADGLKLSTLIHSAAVSTLVQIRDTGDWTQGARLLGVLPSGVRVKALAHWYDHFSGGAAEFSYNAGEGVWVCKLAKKRTPEMFDVAGAIAKPFGDLTPEKGYETQTADAVVAMLKRKVESKKLVHEDGTPIMTDDARALWLKLYNAAVEVRDGAASDAAKAAAKLNADEQRRRKAAAKATKQAQAASRAETDAALAAAEKAEQEFNAKLAKLVEKFGEDSPEVANARAIRASIELAA